jgi:hypothetical protein
MDGPVFKQQTHVYDPCEDQADIIADILPRFRSISRCSCAAPRLRPSTVFETLSSTAHCQGSMSRCCPKGGAA